MKYYKLWLEGLDEPCEELDNENSVCRLAPIADEPAILALEVGQSHVDSHGDRWERIE